MLEDETLLERFYNERYIPSKHTKFIEDAVNSIGIEESEFGILGDIVDNMFDQSLHKSGVYKKMSEEREKKIQEQKEKEAKEKESKKERRDKVMEESASTKRVSIMVLKRIVLFSTSFWYISMLPANLANIPGCVTCPETPMNLVTIDLRLY
jgi:hypothetical protein